MRSGLPKATRLRFEVFNFDDGSIVVFRSAKERRHANASFAERKATMKSAVADFQKLGRDLFLVMQRAVDGAHVGDLEHALSLGVG